MTARIPAGVLVAVACFLGMLAPVPVRCHAAAASTVGNTRTYYVAADEVDWDYAPTGPQ